MERTPITQLPSAIAPCIGESPRPKPGAGFEAFPLADVEQSIASRFHAQVMRNPDALAVNDAAQRMSYGELDALSNRLAHAIVALNVLTATPVALLLDTQITQIVGLLGVLKAGHGYVPVDTTLPAARVSAILEDTAPVLLIVCNATESQGSTASSGCLHVLNLDALDEALPVSDPEVDIAPDALAYALFTSGTTGRPKGVMQSQRNVLHNVMRHTNSFLIGRGDRQTLLYSYAVYGGTRDIFNALLNGASLHVYCVAQQGVSGLAEWMFQERISIYCSVATVFRHLLHTPTHSTSFPDLRLIKLGGEATYRRDIEQLQPLLQDGCVVHCGLGATETGLARTFWVDRDTRITEHAVPLGYPVEGMDVLVLDEAGQPVLPGEIGEILIQSPYVALGYWGNEALSQNCFSPSETSPGARRYRTGDLGVMRADGCLEHRGRKDFQVKIRGNRVEIAEVEQSLLGLPQIAEAVVMPRPYMQDENRLVAYVVARPGHDCFLPIIRKALAVKLPSFMLPEAMVVLEEFPQLANGKVNRNALPEPDSQIARQHQVYAPACTPFEHELVSLWEKMLGIKDVGIDDNFFELGGHSLLATRILAEFVDGFDMQPPVEVMFEHPTIRALALHMVKMLAQDEEEA
jgi:amino acid adenylation domain-containing protein